MSLMRLKLRPNHRLLKVPEPLESSSEDDDKLELNDFELPTFEESDAFEAFAGEPFEPEMLSEPDSRQDSEQDDFSIDDVKLPEFGEEQALDSFAQAGDFEINENDFAQEFRVR